MDQIIKILNNLPTNGKYLLELDKNIYEFSVDTLYETSNLLDELDPMYCEYFACSVKVENVVKINNFKSFHHIGDLIELSIQRMPYWISTLNGDILFITRVNERL